MPQYLIKAPCIYINADGSVSHHREPGAVADIPEDAAAELGDAVQPLVTGALPDRFAAERLPDVKADVDKARRGKRDVEPVVEPDGNG